MRDKILPLILDAVRDMAEETDRLELAQATPDTVLYGKSGILDSVALVSLVVDVEDRVEDTFGLRVSLADERAMSLKVSPFSQAKRLAVYIETLLKEQGAG